MVKVRPEGQAAVTMQGVWKEFQEKPKFFSTVELAEDGGFGEVKTLFTMDRFFWALVTLACIVLNLYSILPNVITLVKEDWTVESAEKPKLLVLSAIANRLTPDGKAVRLEVLTALLELSLLFFNACKILRCIYWMGRTRVEVMWYGVADLMWDVLPDLSSMSAMKCLFWVTPQILTRDVSFHLLRTVRKGCRNSWLPLLTFLLSRVFCLLIGFEAFMIKYVTNSRDFNAAVSWISSLIISAGFLNQMLGVVDVNRFTKQRLFIFVFGGEDGFLCEREEMVAKTWMSMLARNMWFEARRSHAKLCWFLAVTLSYCDADFQQLTLNASAIAKAKEKKELTDMECPGAEPFKMMTNPVDEAEEC